MRVVVTGSFVWNCPVCNTENLNRFEGDPVTFGFGDSVFATLECERCHQRFMNGETFDYEGK